MTTPIFDILGFGAVAVDDLLYVDEYPPAESKVRVRHRLRQCGGLTGTALVAAARLGASCAYVGLLGNDELSKYVLDCFAREGIDAIHCVRRAKARPAHSTIIVDEHQKTRTIFASLAGEIGADAQSPPAELIRSARVILVDHHGLEGAIRAAGIARESGVAVVADFERKPDGNFAELLSLVDHLVISARFAAELTGKNEPEQATSALWTAKRRAVVVTCGARGSWLLAQDFKKPLHCQAHPVKVIDTTGCGDVFHGAYSAALARGKSPVECVELASAAAALKATKRGGQAGCPTLQSVEEFLQRTK
ncbi:MAG: PfkB family carbohydrate kinase [Thermoguttaceae bacterium]|jgi:sugar/nucleoside kinase (ribokinase family)